MPESGYRACFSNLVIYTEDREDEAILDGVLSEYVIIHPCRIILIHANPRATKPRLESIPVLRTFTGPTGWSVACEQITIHVDGPSVKEIGGAVQPMLAADLPVNIWWRGVFLSQRQLFEQLVAFADRFIYDGAQWTNLHYTVLQVVDCIKTHSAKVGFTNFNWSRLRPWRDSVADFFDAGIYEREVWDINRVRVEYMALPGNEEGQHFRALLLVAWLAVQLGWKPQSGQSGTELSQIHFEDKKARGVDAELALLPQSGPSSQSLQRVVLGIQSSPEPQEFVVERDAKDHLMILTARTSKGTIPIRKTPHSDSHLAELLHRELGRRVRNRVFERTFEMAAQLLQMI
jgi:glucose-6-phosphate dehydrogenase assembly protein OpcA